MDAQLTKILWRQVWGLAALLVALMFGWMVYGTYQAEILTNLGFAQMAAWLGLMQAIAAAITEPIVGLYSDRLFHRMASRLPVILAGVAVAGAVFVIVALLLPWMIPLGLRWLVPVLMTVWVVSMVVARGPAIAQLRIMAPTSQLPAANGLLNGVFALMGALGDPISGLARWLGPAWTFGLGAIVLAIGFGFLWASRSQALKLPIAPPSGRVVSWARAGWIVSVGIAAGLTFSLLLKWLPKLIHTSYPDLSASHLTTGMLLISALMIVPLQGIPRRFGTAKTMAASMGGIALFAGLTLLAPTVGWVIVGCLVLGSALNLLSTTQIPFALGAVPSDYAGLGTGLYFGGMGMGSALLETGHALGWQGAGFVMCGLVSAWGLSMVGFRQLAHITRNERVISTV